jgi:hypothetical protein
MDVPPLRLVLEIDPTTAPLTGKLSQCGSEPKTFTGWTQLGHAVDTAIAAAAADTTKNQLGHEERATP